MDETYTQTSILPEPQTLIGTWRRFGSGGPVYEIVSLGQALSSDLDRITRVRVIETGEEVDYRFRDILDDPPEH